MRQQKRMFENMKETVKRRLRHRRLFLNPFKLDPIKHIQRYALSDKEWAALAFLRSNPLVSDIVNRAGWVALAPSKSGMPPEAMPWAGWRIDPGNTDRHITMVNVKVDWRNLPSQVRDYMLQWGERDLELKESNLRAWSHFAKVGELVRTWGQLHRVWPSLLPLYPSDIRYEILNKKAKSKLPDDIKEHTGGLFDPVRIEDSDMVFAEMMLIPADADVTEFADPDVDFRSGIHYPGF